MTNLRFNGLWPWWLILSIGIIGSLWIARWYYRESRYIRKPLSWILPCLRGLAFLLILLMLAGPILVHKTIEGELSLVSVLLDQSRSMSISDDANVTTSLSSSPASTDRSRLGLSLDWLVGSSASKAKDRFLGQLGENHRVQWFGMDVVEQTGTAHRLLWDSQSNVEIPDRSKLDAITDRSRIADSISSIVSSNPAAIVIVTDGQSNAGTTIADAATLAANAKIPVFAIGVGGAIEPNDFGILNVEHSQRVFRADRLRGTLEVKEQAAPGTAYRVHAKHQGATVWSKELQSSQQALRRIEFDIPAELLVDAAKAQQTVGFEHSLLPIDLEFSIDSDSGDIYSENNSLASSLWGVDRKNRILLLDKRGGWETRYIKNALQRDSAWEVTVAIGPEPFAGDFFPPTRDALFDFDLVLMSLESVPSLKDNQIEWLQDFVSLSGGGMIFIDSIRPVADADKEKLTNLLPVQLLDTQDASPLQSIRLALAANTQPAFQLGSTPESNPQIWSKLPAPKSLRSVTLAPASETLIEAIGVDANSPRPLMVTKLFGQGRIIYSATDETWRWRYNVADLYHQRFWNQIATWTMRAPFAVNDTFASLDTGRRMISSDEVITIRAKLKQQDSQPMDNATVQAVVERDGKRIAAIPLTQELDARGFYRATAGPYEPGRYEVRLEAAGIPSEALKISSQFTVQSPVDTEMQFLACNNSALQQIADATSGEFVMLEQADQIQEKLKRFRTGKVVESQTLLWQSYPWFATIMLLLAAEWYLRKRVGLI